MPAGSRGGWPGDQSPLMGTFGCSFPEPVEGALIMGLALRQAQGTKLSRRLSTAQGWAQGRFGVPGDPAPGDVSQRSLRGTGLDRAVGAQAEDEGNAVVAVGLDDPVDGQAAGDHGVPVVGQGQVPHAEPGPDAALTPPGRGGVPARPAIGRVDDPRGLDILDVRPVEARMHAVADQGAAGHQDPGDLPQHLAEIVDVGGDPGREYGLERGVGEREPLGVAEHDPVPVARPGVPELITGQVEPDRVPAGFLDQVRIRPGPAAEVETAPRTSPQKLAQGIEIAAGGIPIHRLVPVGLSVIACHRHPPFIRSTHPRTAGQTGDSRLCRRQIAGPSKFVG